MAVGFVSDVNSEMVIPGNALPNSAAVLVLPVRPLRSLFEPHAAQLWLMPWQTRQRYSPFSFSQIGPLQLLHTKRWSQPAQ
jgi:hypothetical protein